MKNEKRPEESGIVDPLAAARWGQVRGDEEGIRAEWSGAEEVAGARGPEPPPVDDEDAGLAQGGSARNRLTEDSGDPGGER